MKKSLCILSICAVIAACGGGNNSESSDNTGATEQPAETTPQTETAEAPEAGQSAASEGSDKGKELIAQSDCLTCHKEHDKLVGPSYADVAKKYTATDENIDHLVSKIIEGGKGVWGEIPMTPHPSLSKEDAREMVKYILSIK